MEAGQLTGNWLSDLRKVADRYRGQEGISDIKVIKDTLFETTGVNPQVSSFPKKNFSDIDTKELAVGINIVIAKDGRKIIAKNESGEIQDLSRQYPI